MEGTKGQTLRSGCPDEDGMLATMTRVLQFLPIVMHLGTGQARYTSYISRKVMGTHALPYWLSVHPSLTGWSGVDSEAAVDAISGICDSYIVSPHLIRAIGGHSSETGEVLHYYCDSLTMYRPNVEAFISQGDILLCLIND